MYWLWPYCWVCKYQFKPLPSIVTKTTTGKQYPSSQVSQILWMSKKEWRKERLEAMCLHCLIIHFIFYMFRIWMIIVFHHLNTTWHFWENIEIFLLHTLIIPNPHVTLSCLLTKDQWTGGVVISTGNPIWLSILMAISPAEITLE